MADRRWAIHEADPVAAAELARRLGTSPILAQVLLNRGLSDAAACTTFLRPSLSLLHDPSTLPNLKRAAQRIAQAIRDHQQIVIYGDYDVDGITATAILWHAITLLGGNVRYYIPHRLEEGYGLNSEAIEQICADGAQLIITVDCGITAIEPVNVACGRGVDVIVTDHHEWHEAIAPVGTGAPGDVQQPPTSAVPLLPDCLAIVHPRLPGHEPAYANPSLCGAGVAFKLAWGIGQAMNGAARVDSAFRAFLVEATALAALGTIADVVPLVGENRVLAHFGLGGLKQSNLRGLRALIASAGLTGQKLDSYHVGFLLAPRLNACGRMGHARLAVEMLTDADDARASEIALYLESQNRQRQSIERQILDQSLAQIAQLGLDGAECRAIVLGSAGWHPGVIGIVASRIVDRFNRPTVMVSLDNGHGQGSGRSIAGFHLAHALEACGQYLESYGGHEMAAGLRLASAHFEEFRAAFCQHAARALVPDQLVRVLRLDCLAELRQLGEALVGDLRRIGPFGHGNPRPILCFRDLEVALPPRRVGKTGDHLQLSVRQHGASLRCIAFGLGDMLPQLAPGTRIDLAAEPTLNEFNGRVSVELDVKDIRMAG